MATQLTQMQTELLILLSEDDRYGVRDRRIARALERKGLAKYYETSNAWAITPAGRALVRLHIT